MNSIDNNFGPIFDVKIIKKDEGFLYTNYFGLKNGFISQLSLFCKNLIIDNSQAFFALPKPGIPTFYSCRKFFGVPYGAYLYLDETTDKEFPPDSSFERFSQLLKRIEYGAEMGYNDFRANETNLICQPIKKMSNLKKALLFNIDYSFVRQRRRRNFLKLHKTLSHFNNLHLELDDQSIPLVYPLLFPEPNLKQRLIDKKIFVPIFWTEVLKRTSDASIQFQFATGIIHLPIIKGLILMKCNTLLM